MELDLRSFVFALSFVFVMQAIALYVISRLISNFNGLKNWAWGCAFMALGFLSIFFRNIEVFSNLSIILSNLFHYLSMLLLLYGSQQFIGKKARLRFWFILLPVYMALIAYFTFIESNINMRVIVYSLLIGLLALNNALIFFVGSKKHIKGSGLFIGAIYTSIFFLLFFRTVFILERMPLNDTLLDNSSINNFTFVASMALGLLLTLALIIGVNQKLKVELEELNAEKDRFFSVIAHDLRSPFASIISLTEVLADKDFGLEPRQIHELAASVNKTAHATSNLLNDLLDWSGFKRGMKVFAPCRLVFGDFMRASLSTLEDAAERKQISFKNHIDENTEICADPHMFQTVVRNLVSNAIKFTPKGGRIVLSNSITPNGEMVFSIKDNGIGMSATSIERLFDPLKKIRRVGTDGEPSSGIGLLLCKEFVELHEGRIWVESDEGLGTTFYFTLAAQSC